MARARKQPPPAPDELEELDWQYRGLALLCMASEPGTAAAAISQQVSAERARLDKAGLPPGERLEALWEFIGQLGWRGHAEQHMRRMEATRRRRESRGRW